MPPSCFGIGPHRAWGLVLCLCGLASVLAKPVQGEDWPQFRGPNCSGVSTSTRSLPVEFSSEKNVCWSVEVGDGIGSPVIASGRAFTTGMSKPQVFSVYGFDAATGKKLWQHDYPTGDLLRITPPNSHASSTPATDGERVYVYFSTLGLVALDAVDGHEVWKYPLPKPAYLMDWGAAASPIVYKDLLVFDQDDDLTPFILALDKRTGDLRWRTERGDMLAGYSVPVICTANGRTDIVVAGSGKLKGYDPATGKELWTCNTLLRTIMTTPVVKDGVIYTSVQSYGDSGRTLKFALLEWLDTNQDGQLARTEVPKPFTGKFDQSDKNGDKILDVEELDTAFQAPTNMAGGGATVQAVRGGGTGDVTETHVLWNLHNRAPSNLSSPIVFDEQLFVVKRGGLSSAYQIDTGKALWETKRIRNLGDYYASPVAADGKLYVTGENGFIIVLEQGPELKVLAKNDMGASCLAPPAVADGRLFIRTRDKLFCVGEKSLSE